MDNSFKEYFENKGLDMDCKKDKQVELYPLGNPHVGYDESACEEEDEFDGWVDQYTHDLGAASSWIEISNDRVTSLLYTLIESGKVSCSDLDECVAEVLEESNDVTYANGWLARYSQYISRRLQNG